MEDKIECETSKIIFGEKGLALPPTMTSGTAAAAAN